VERRESGKIPVLGKVNGNGKIETKGAAVGAVSGQTYETETKPKPKTGPDKREAVAPGKKKSGRGQYRYIGDVLGKWMKAKGMKQVQIGENAGIHYTHISKYFLNKTAATEPTIEKLAKAFGCTPAEFLRGPRADSGGEKPAKNDRPRFESRKVGEVLEAWMIEKARSREDVSNSAGIDRAILRGILDGGIEVGGEMIERLAKVFRVTPEEFLAGPSSAGSKGKFDEYHRLPDADRYVIHAEV